MVWGGLAGVSVNSCAAAAIIKATHKMNIPANLSCHVDSKYRQSIWIKMLVLRQKLSVIFLSYSVNIYNLLSYCVKRCCLDFPKCNKSCSHVIARKLHEM